MRSNGVRCFFSISLSCVRRIWEPPQYINLAACQPVRWTHRNAMLSLICMWLRYTHDFVILFHMKLELACVVDVPSDDGITVRSMHLKFIPCDCLHSYALNDICQFLTKCTNSRHFINKKTCVHVCHTSNLPIECVRSSHRASITTLFSFQKTCTELARSRLFKQLVFFLSWCRCCVCRFFHSFVHRSRRRCRCCCFFLHFSVLFFSLRFGLVFGYIARSFACSFLFFHSNSFNQIVVVFVDRLCTAYIWIC